MPIEIIDTHLHLVYLERFSYPWLDGVPALNRDFTLETYRPQAEANGIVQAQPGNRRFHLGAQWAIADEVEMETGLSIDDAPCGLE